jgi:hypothetical protein
MVVFGAILIRRPCPTIFVCVVWPNFTLVGQAQQKVGGGCREKRRKFSMWDCHCGAFKIDTTLPKMVRTQLLAQLHHLKDTLYMKGGDGHFWRHFDP